MVSKKKALILSFLGAILLHLAIIFFPNLSLSKKRMSNANFTEFEMVASVSIKPPEVVVKTDISEAVLEVLEDSSQKEAVVPKAPSYDHYLNQGKIGVKPIRDEKIKANYPSFAREEGLEGIVRLKVWIDEKGRVQKVEPIGKSAGNGFDEEAMDMLWRSTFTPALDHDGNTVPVVIIYPVIFKLD